MFERVKVVGRGRVDTAVRERLRERQVAIGDERADLVLRCVPDSAIRESAAAVPPGPWVAHVSGATSLRALDPHVRRGDWATVEAHLAEISVRAPDLEAMYRALATVTTG